ncbi:MAG: PocR ligand-binding domain-containing protein [Lachnospiraceae bacterium]|nr:PocR ligand-binding domain-containing protein [Lachnospiraceae bacterium]
MPDVEKDDLLEWLDIDEITSIQQSFNHISGMPVSVMTVDGNLLTPKIGGTTFCDILVQQCAPAYSLCANCRKYGACEARNLRHGTYYYCHMGLVEFAAPFIIDGQMVAYLVSGMIFDRPPRERDIRNLASIYDIDPDFLWEAAKKVPVCNHSLIEKAVDGLYNYALIVSSTTEGRLKTARAGAEIERAAQMKNDFLANMSHEIRTPMNAVIGMADLALHEDISSNAKEYIEQIQSSGKALLHIINDILDFSKITSGKMNIFEDPYSIAQIVHDVTPIITTRLGDKSDKVALTVEVDPGLPTKLIGDAARIQQIIINLANNAVKFTNDGYINLSVKVTEIEDNSVKIKVSVSDTGIGIKPEDQAKLFESFTQVDSRRNRTIEGTGLGLAIVKQLVSIMGGTVTLDSEYGKGSTFSFEIPQGISDRKPLCRLEDPKKYAFLAVNERNNAFHHFHSAADLLGVHIQSVDESEVSFNTLSRWAGHRESVECYVVIDKDLFKNGFLEKNSIPNESLPNLKIIVLAGTYDDVKKIESNGNVSAIKDPVTTLNLSAVLAKNSGKDASEEDKAKDNYKFTAPDAKVLIVDDVPMNLKLAQRLLERLKIKSDLAASGQEALDLLVTQENYDIIFMDHMMPGLDGIDTTRLIRRFHPIYNGIPIIALTANVMEDAKKMFLDEGMSDIIPKPIEVQTLNEKLLKWLPPNKIIRST